MRHQRGWHCTDRLNAIYTHVGEHEGAETSRNKAGTREPLDIA